MAELLFAANIAETFEAGEAGIADWPVSFAQMPRGAIESAMKLTAVHYREEY